ncbi:PREDICTED: probable RNA methyltransferase At5g51130 [Lupinus angustifolius]|uniref:probable RNA methyltransferase At5g51130 n=1 Tax=Lupinus angustifolius TaxID=3871 RepID=UPI00092E436A|nr:PREDICTED: probable RNA methyltransferase At5g51130 [Lupinus angustifolius]
MENNAAQEENQNVEQQQQEEIEVDLPQDPRLKLLNKAWIEGLDCLHIGCNDGKITIQIAKEFRCWSIHGIDILPSRISEANLNLSRTVDPISVEAYWELDTSSSSGLYSDDEIPMEQIEELPQNQEQIEELLQNQEIIEEFQGNEEHNVGPFLRNPSDIISFKIENIYRNEIRLMINEYDMILCLSTTHWTEMNLEGHNLVTLFRRLWYNLRSKGRIVLEPKSLKPYGSNFYDSEAEEPKYRKVYQINSNGECIVVFKK